MPGITFRNFHGTDFEDENEVGWGFSGLVLKSRHRPSNHIVARKIIHETPRKRRELKVTHKEVEFYEKMQGGAGGDNIVQCFGVMPVGGKGHIHGGLVFEFMDCGSLADFQQSHAHAPLPEPIILYLAENLLKACVKLESLGIVHRDIKPSNILFSSKGDVKLCDFGEACYRWESENASCDYGNMAGSTAYMSPERLAGREHSHSADIWSVGLVLLELTRDSFPFSTETETDSSDASFDADCSIIELWEMVMETDPLPRVSSENYSIELRNFVDLCMKRDPNMRPSAGQLLESFSHLFEKKSTQAEFINFISSQ